MPILSWLCSNTKGMVVKVVHQGGHVELYDRPVVANEILVRNPRCHVAQPSVFKQPWAVVSPETMLMPGQKFYVVPTSTIKKLQKLALKNSPNLFLEMQAMQSSRDRVGDAEKEAFRCWLCTDGNTKKGKQKAREITSEKSCFGCFISASKIKNTSENQSSETNSSNGSGSGLGNGTENSPKRNTSFDSWQPCLESIVEE